MVPRAVEAVQESCELIQASAQAYCPVDTGALQASITIDPPVEGDTVTGSVAPHEPYASYVEYGTGDRGDPDSALSPRRRMAGDGRSAATCGRRWMKRAAR